MNNYKKTIKNRKGTTIVEVLLSVALLAIIVTPLLGAVLSAIQNNVASKDRIEAIALAEEVISQIKAKKTILLTVPIEPGVPEVPYISTYIGSGDLVPYYEITSTFGTITENIDTTYNYDISEADNPDFELVIDQGIANNDELATVVFKKIDSSEGETISFSNLSVSGTILKLKVVKTGADYNYFFGENSEKEDLKVFTPKSLNNIKLKVTYASNNIPNANAAEQLNIFTYLDFDAADIFKVYVVNNEEANSGVNFINKGTMNKFEVIYMDTHAFSYDTSDPLNQLFKIAVKIKKNDKEIYSTSTYVKK